MGLDLAALRVFGRPLTMFFASLLLATPVFGQSGARMTTNVPAELAASVEGCWDLTPSYRIVIARHGQRLAVDQTTTNAQGTPCRRHAEVRYDPKNKTLSFEGIGRIHRTRVTLRRGQATELEFAFSSELAPGKWRSSLWEPATRCTNDAHGE